MASESLFNDRRAGMAYLVEGQVLRSAGPCVADLLLRLQDGQIQSLKVLVTSKGRIQEMVRTPSSVQTMCLIPGQGGKPMQVDRLAAKRMSAIEHRLRQAWRILSTLVGRPPHLRARVGLTLKTLLSDFDDAYEVACRLRANVRTGEYSDWYQEFYGVASPDRAAMAAVAENWSQRPFFHIVVLCGAGNTEADFEATQASLSVQTYRHFRIERRYCGAGAGRVGFGSLPEGAWHVFIRAGSLLSEQALFCVAHAVVRKPDAAFVYADHDMIGTDGRLHSPVFKSDWSPEMLRASNYIEEAFAWNGQYLPRLELEAYDTYADAVHGLLLTLGDLRLPVVHVPAPLWHMSEQGPKSNAAQVVRRHLERTGIMAHVVDTGPGCCRIRYLVEKPAPLVSVIIPTRDGIDHLRRCITSVLSKTTYQPYEILIVDNESVLPETLSYLREVQNLPGVRVLPFPRKFNYSSINNMAVGQARGELVCLLNNDTEVISSDWLEEMVGLLLRDDVGVVGAKLLYEDGRVQHAGDTVGPGGCANHLHVGIDRHDPGYAGRALIAQELSAVTAACLLTKRTVYERLGGLEEKNLKVAFNDVDYCLRVREAGMRVIWTPHALLFHHESATRGKDETPAQLRRAKEEIRYMRRRWMHVLHHDPYYNPNLNYLQPDFTLSSAPMAYRPWRTAGQ